MTCVGCGPSEAHPLLHFGRTAFELCEDPDHHPGGSRYLRIERCRPHPVMHACVVVGRIAGVRSGYSHTSWKRILNPGFQDGSRSNPKYVSRARDCCVIELIPLPFQICDRIFQRVTSDSIKCNGSFVRSLYGRICRGGQGGDREIARDRGWLRGMVWSGRVEILHVCTNDS